MAAFVDPVTRVSGGADPGATSAQSKVDPGQIASKEAFLRLLVAQIRHQNPLNPADGVQFLTQLAQFSELEQMISIRQEVEALRREITVNSESRENPAEIGVQGPA